jgi:hypothetical protein
LLSLVSAEGVAALPLAFPAASFVGCLLHAASKATIITTPSLRIPDLALLVPAGIRIVAAQ